MQLWSAIVVTSSFFFFILLKELSLNTAIIDDYSEYMS